MEQQEYKPKPSREEILNFLFSISPNANAIENLKLGSWGWTYSDGTATGLDNYLTEIKNKYGIEINKKEITKRTLGQIADLILEKL